MMRFYMIAMNLILFGVLVVGFIFTIALIVVAAEAIARTFLGIL